VKSHSPFALHVTVPNAGADGQGVHDDEPKQPLSGVLPVHTALQRCSVEPQSVPPVPPDPVEDDDDDVDVDVDVELVALTSPPNPPEPGDPPEPGEPPAAVPVALRVPDFGSASSELSSGWAHAATRRNEAA
jgi:hypothetical protein